MAIDRMHLELHDLVRTVNDIVAAYDRMRHVPYTREHARMEKQYYRLIKRAMNVKYAIKAKRLRFQMR